MADAAALSLGARVTALQNAHAWMDAPLVATLAVNAATPQDAVQHGDTMRNSLQNTWDAVAGAWDDPVLYTHDGADVQLRRFLSNSLSPPPIAAPDLDVTLRNLQSQGFGVGLPLDGTWGPEKQQALSDAHRAYMEKAYAGDRPLAVNSHKAAHGFLSSIMPKTLVHNLIGYAKAFPRAVADTAADVIGGAAEVGSLLPLGVEQAVTGHGAEGIRMAQRGGARIGTTVNTLTGGKRMTAQEFYNRQTGAAQVVNDIGTLLWLVPGGAGTRAATTAGKGAAGAARTGVVKGLTDVSSDASLAAARRQPMVIARTLTGGGIAGRAARGGAVGGGVGAVTAAANNGDVLQGFGTGALGGAAGNVALGSHLGRALTEKAPGFLANHPLEARTSPIVGKLANEQGLYYRARTLLAQPYRIPAVRGVGSAYAKAVPYGALVAGQSALAGHLDPNNSLSASLARANGADAVLDPLDMRLHAMTAGLTGSHVSVGLDDLALVLHGEIPTLGRKGTSSAEVGKVVETLHDHANDALGVVGADGAITRAMRAVHGKKWTPRTQIDTTFGGDTSAYNEFWTDKLQDLAVSRYAEDAVWKWTEDNGGVAPSAAERKQLLQTAAHEIWNNKELLDEHFNDLIASGTSLGTGEIENRLRSQAIGGLAEPEMKLRHGAKAYITAKREAVAILSDPEAVKSLVHPDAWEALSAQRGASGSFGAGGPTRAWLGANTDLAAPGSVGMARLGTLSKGDAHKIIDGFEALLHAAPDEAARAQIANEAHSWLNLHANYDPKSLSVYRHDMNTDGSIPLVDRMREYADTLGSKVHLAVDASPELRAAVGRMEAEGYQLWHGTDIGHAIRVNRSPLQLAQTGITKRRALISRMGLNAEHFRSADISDYRRDALRRHLQNLVDDGKLTLPPYWTPDTLITDLRARAGEQAQLGTLRGSIFEATQAFRKTLVGAQAQAQGKEREQVIAQMKNELAQYHETRAIPRKVLHQILSSADDVPYATGLAREVEGTSDLPLFTPEHIDLIHDAILRSSRAPGYMIGAARFDDLIRSVGINGFGLAGKSWAGPLGPAAARVGRRTARVGNAYGIMRDNFRFTMSPAFSARRVTKTNIKVAAEGLQPTVTPVKDMLEAGTYEQNHRLLARLYPELASHEQDEFDRALHAADIFAIYQPRQYMAAVAGQAKAKGYSDDAVKELLTHVFEYGSSRFGEGRTAAERTANTIFFPFSFEKTVLRNIGGYLMDHPAQLLALNAGIAAYSQFSEAHPDNPLSHPWLEAHVPLLTEVERLNPFAHGLSPGEFGGINAPLLNMFLPQSWDGKDKGNQGRLARFVPALHDLNRVWSETGQQSTIVHSALQNAYDYAEDKRATDPFFKYRPTTTPDAQRTAAFADRRKLVAALQPVLDANRHLAPGSKYMFADDPSIDPALRGEVVTKGAIDRLLHEIYPAYDPNGAAKYAAQVQGDSAAYLDSIKGSPNFLAYATFASSADAFRGYVEAGDYRDYPGQQAQLTAQLRAFALAAASQGNDGKPDKGFLHWYNRTFAKTLGPLTGAP